MATIWRTENFSRGLHTKPARAEGGESYAADIKNLRIDKDGWLQLRDAFSDVASRWRGYNRRGDNRRLPVSCYVPTASCMSDRYLRLVVKRRSPTSKSSQVEISIVATFRDYVVITSEGDDQGYWIDLRNRADIQAHTLGIEPPPDDAFEIEVESIHQYPVANNPLATPHVYLYKITYVPPCGRA